MEAIENEEFYLTLLNFGYHSSLELNIQYV